MTKFKYAILTTFPFNAWQTYARPMVQSVILNVDRSIPLLIALDEPTHEETFEAIKHEVNGQNVMLSKEISPEHKAFLEANPQPDPAKGPYQKQLKRFCHKVFSMHSVSKMEEIDYLIWMDADILVHQPITI